MKFLMVAFLVISLGGCATSGHRITDGMIEKIVVGETTIENMRQLFGKPLSQSYGQDSKLSMIWHYMRIEPFGIVKAQNLAVLFDEGDKVEKYNFIDSTD